MDIQGYTMYQVEVRLSATAMVLAPLEVVARSRGGITPTLAGFERRRLSGTGWFTTRAEIQRRNATSVSDILRSAPGISIQRRIVYMARAGGCPAQIYIDGFHINRPIRSVPGRRAPSSTEAFPIDEMVAPVSVEGIEVYQGLSTVPAEFLSPEAACGVVAIWTRRGR
jgi:outer membrane receptor for ferrienterochelin and colicin